MSSFRLVAAGLLVSAAGPMTPLLISCQSPRASTEVVGPPPSVTIAEPEWVPLELFRDRLAFLPAVLEGVATEGLLDSGAVVTVLSTDLARRLGLEPSGRARLGGVGGSRTADFVEGLTLEIGNVVLRDLRAAVLDLSEVEVMAGRPLPLVLGREVFQHSVVDLDFPNRRVAFRDSATFTHGGTGATVPLHDEGGAWRIRARIDGGPAGRFALDTGSMSHMTVFGAFTREQRLLEHLGDVSTDLGGGVGGTVELLKGTLRSFELGPVVFREVPANFHTGEKGLFAHSTADGNLGAGLLTRFRATFDVPRGRVHLEPGPAWDAPFQKNRAGLSTRFRGSDLEVVHVAEGSPAARDGWRPGDRIVSIDGEPVARDYFVDLFRWCFRPAGTTVLLEDGKARLRPIDLDDYF